MSSGLAVSAQKVVSTSSLSQKMPIPIAHGMPSLSTLINGYTDNFTDADSKITAAVNKQDQGEVTCWLIDTRELWPGTKIWSAPGAAEALSLVSLPEQKAIATKIFIADARMSLASALLKRAYISQALDIPWKDVRLGRKGDAKHGKPCAVDIAGRPIEGIDFNVSHQNGLVALIGWNGKLRHKYLPGGGVEGLTAFGGNLEPEIMVGVDIVCVNERDEYRTIDAEGFDGWVDMYDYVFSDEERWNMTHEVDSVTMLDGTIISREELGRYDRYTARHHSVSITSAEGKRYTFPSDLIVDAKLRRFYTYFCYKEAYIKLAGEALLAPWLKQLEFFNVRSPKPGVAARCSTLGQWGETVSDVEVLLHGHAVNDVRMKIQAFEEKFMLSTAVQGQIEGVRVPEFHKVHLQSEILDYAHKHLSSAPSDFR